MSDLRRDHDSEKRRRLVAQARGLVIAALIVGVGIAAAPPGEVESKTGAAPDRRRDEPPNAVRFNQQVRPILSDKCFRCHGPDAAARQAGLRLDSRQGALAVLETGGSAIVPGNVAASRLFERITSHDDGFRMPPPESGKTLSAGEIVILRQWIEEGVAWESHWSFIAPTRPEPPEVSNPDWVRNPIDQFVLARLDRANLAPSTEADRATLIRRLSLDLNGLPPTVEAVDQFLGDQSPNAYEDLVDRLLASPRYGEHLARYWLDAARYGDTHGLHLDNERIMWPWRDWVINALNDNMRFDQFTIEQLAGDLLPEPTTDQIIATGFNRNNVTTSEGGAIDEEYLVKYAADRVETTSTVWMGLTVGCAQCHDHKFDPVSQREYYQLFAYFNNITENAMDGNQRDPPPVLRALTPESESLLASIRIGIASLEAQLDAPLPEVDAQQQAWQDDWGMRWSQRWRILDPVEFRSTGGATLRRLDDASILSEGENPAIDTYEIVARVDGVNFRVLRLEALTHESLPHNGPGRAENANFVLSEIEADIVSVVDPDERRTIRFVAAAADHEQLDGPYPISHAIDGVIDEANGWAVEGFSRREDRTAMFVPAEPFGYAGGTEMRVRLRFETHFAKHAIGRIRLSVTADEELHTMLAPSGIGPWQIVGPFQANDGKEAFKLPFGPEQHIDRIDLAATYRDGELAWQPQPDLVDGTVHTLEGESCATYLHRVIESPTSRQMELSLGSDDGIKVWVNGRLVHEKDVARGVAPNQDRIAIDLKAGRNLLVMKIVNITGGYGFYFKKASEGAGGGFLRIVDLLASGDNTIGPEQAAVVRRYFRRHHSPELRAVYDELQVEHDREADLLARLPTTLVMQEQPERRQTYLLRRGEYDQPRDPVDPGVPAVLPPLPPDATPDRLGLARWLVGPDHPLTSRVIVNRLWQQLFGTGLVKTVEDFGSQGQWPSHPELVDWLACEFVESEWNAKHMLKLMVTSATYRQAAALTPALRERDPENRLYARGSRFRMDAEMIRDQALSAGGLLVEKLGGPSVRPYQPSGLWKTVAYPDSDTQVFRKDDGEAQYRRSLYTFWKRTSPPPNLAAFDAPTRETCTVRRARTNTPTQVLVLLNDPQFVEAARCLAQRALREGGPDADSQVALAFRFVLARQPTQTELNVLTNLYREQLHLFQQDQESARQLLSTGDSLRDESLDIAAHAAMTNVASVILSLDEAVTKG